MISINPRKRIIHHLDYLKEQVTITNEKDNAIFEQEYEVFTLISKRLLIYQWIYLLSGLLLYMGLVTTVAQTISPLFTLVLSPFIAISGLLGFTVLTGLFLFMGQLVYAVTIDLLTEHARLVSILTKYTDKELPPPKRFLGVLRTYK